MKMRLYNKKYEVACSKSKAYQHLVVKMGELTSADTLSQGITTVWLSYYEFRNNYSLRSKVTPASSTFQHMHK